MNDIAPRAVGVLLLFIAAGSIGQEKPRVLYFQDDKAERTPSHTVIPAYPKRARRERIEGEVQVCFKVDHFGKPYRIGVRRSSNRIFEKPAIHAVRESTYLPLAPDQKVSGIKTCRTFRFLLEPVEPDDSETPGLSGQDLSN
jgi:TonB family protein